jgi:hypothetical protein
LLFLMLIPFAFLLLDTVYIIVSTTTTFLQLLWRTTLDVPKVGTQRLHQEVLYYKITRMIHR